jgi:flagellar biogenesis protein FliO
MKSIPKWLLIPPAVALLLLLGMLSMQGQAANGDAEVVQRPTARTTTVLPNGDDARSNRTAPATPRTPDLWQMSSGLIGVVLLGAAALFGLKRLRSGSAASRGTPVMALRQTLRLGARQALHAIEFDERIVLVGESDKGLVLIEHGKLPERAADEAEVLSRGELGRRVDAVAADEDEGAVPKDLVIPRPDHLARRLPKPAVDQATPAKKPGLGDFRNLLQKVGRA